MKHFRLGDMTKGWFVGDFQPAAYGSKDCEVGAKHYRQGDYEEIHHHRVAVEITLVLSGRVRMCGQEWGDGDIIVLSPGEATDFEALTDVTTVVVKLPSVMGDKYIGIMTFPGAEEGIS